MLKVTQIQGFTLSLEDTFLEKRQVFLEKPIIFAKIVFIFLLYQID